MLAFHVNVIERAVFDMIVIVTGLQAEICWIYMDIVPP